MSTLPRRGRSAYAGTTTRWSPWTGSRRAPSTPYRVECDGEHVWPPEDSDLPAVDDPDARPRQAAPARVRVLPHVGLARRGGQQEARGGRAARLRAADGRVTDGRHEDDPDPGDEVRWPDLVLFLGDQVYADETTEGCSDVHRRATRHRRAAVEELKDYEEYAHLYKLAWTDPANRWLLSTVPSAMIFDDHDIRDDWNTSAGVEGRDGGHRLVARPDRRPGWRRTGSTSISATSSPRSGPRTRSGRRSPRTTATDELRRDRRCSTTFADRADQQPGELPVELLPRLRRPGAAGGRGLAGSPGAATPSTARSSTTASWHGWTSSCAAASTTCSSGPPCRSCCRPGLHYVEAWSEALAGALGGAAGRGPARRIRPGRRPRALGGVPGRLPEGRRDGPRGGPRRAGPRTGDGHVPLRRRPPQLCVRGRPTSAERGRAAPDQPDLPGGVLADPQPDEASDAVRRSRCWPTASPDRSATSWPARPRCPNSPLDWKAAQGPVVRQQPGHARGPRPGHADVVGARRDRTTATTTGRDWSPSPRRHRRPVAPAAAGGSPMNAITDVPGIRVGHAQRTGDGWLTGTTVVLAAARGRGRRRRRPRRRAGHPGDRPPRPAQPGRARARGGADRRLGLRFGRGRRRGAAGCSRPGSASRWASPARWCRSCRPPCSSTSAGAGSSRHHPDAALGAAAYDAAGTDVASGHGRRRDRSPGRRAQGRRRHRPSVLPDGVDRRRPGRGERLRLAVDPPTGELYAARYCHPGDLPAARPARRRPSWPRPGRRPPRNPRR